MQNRLREEDVKVIGLTGGTGSGKSSAAKIMEEFGARVVDADKISKELMEKNGDAYKQVVKYFGDGILKPDGEIDRAALGKIVFENKDKLALWSKITHSLVGEEIRKRVEELKKEIAAEPLAKGELKFIVLDVPIPVEEGFFDLSNSVWSVIANDDIRIERIVKRCGITEEEAEKRVNSQMSNREYMEIADVVIENEKDLESLRKYIAGELINYFDIDTDGYGESQ